MNSGHTAERVYDAIRRRIMLHEVRPGDRLDPAALAELLASSVTPVRDALHLLAGVGLVEARTSGGFHSPSIDEPGLKDLYIWAAEVAGLALRGWPRGKPPSVGQADLGQQAAPAVWATTLFATIGNGSANAEHGRATEMLNGRLHAARTVEPHVIDDIGRELQAITTAINRDDRIVLRNLIAAYYKRRQRVAAEIVRALYRVD